MCVVALPASLVICCISDGVVCNFAISACSLFVGGSAQQDFPGPQWQSKRCGSLVRNSVNECRKVVLGGNFSAEHLVKNI